MLAYVNTNSSCLNESASAAVPKGSVNVYLWIACVLSYLNAVTNGFSLAVFILDKKNVIMGRLLLLLSLSETVLNTGFAVNLTVMLAVMADAGRHPFASPLTPHAITCTFFLSFVIANAFIMVRNWCLVMIAGSRCEVVSNPLSTRRGQLFSQGRSQACYAAMLALSLLLCAPRLFEFTWTVCEQPPPAAGGNSTGPVYTLTTATHPNLDRYPSYRHYKTLLVFVVQTIAPIFLISGLSLVIIFTLRRRRHIQQHIGGGGGRGSASRNQDAATKTVMILMFSFIICELPTFVFFILNQTVFPAMKEFKAIRMHTTFLANIMLSADSFTNFIIYSSTSNTFRETVRKMLHLPTNSRTARSGNYNNNNYNNNNYYNNNYTMIHRDANLGRRMHGLSGHTSASRDPASTPLNRNRPASN